MLVFSDSDEEMTLDELKQAALKKRKREADAAAREEKGAKRGDSQ